MEKTKSNPSLGNSSRNMQLFSDGEKEDAAALERKRRRREQVYQAQKRHRKRNSEKASQLEAELQELKIAAVSAGLEENIEQIDNFTMRSMLSAKGVPLELEDLSTESSSTSNDESSSSTALSILRSQAETHSTDQDDRDTSSERDDRCLDTSRELSGMQSIDWFASPTSWRRQLHCVSAHHFFPIQDPWPQWCLIVLNKAERYSATAAALDASCLFMVGLKSGDESLQLAGRTTQMKAVQLLRRDLSLLNTPLRRTDLVDSIVCTVQCLLTCDSFQGSGNTQAAWTTHCHGLISVLSSISTEEPIESLDVLDANICSFTIWYGLLARERVDIDRRIALRPICQIAQRTSALLHTHKERKMPKDGVEVMKTLVELDKVRKLVVEFAPNIFASWKALDSNASFCRNPSAGPAPWETSEVPCSIHEASEIAICAACMIYLRSIAFDLCEESPDATRADFYESQMVFVETLRSAIGYMTRIDEGHIGMFYAVGPLWLVENWYQRLADQGPSQEAERGLAWCKRLQDSFASMGVRCIPRDAFC